MDKDFFKYYRIIGKIQSLIAKSENLEEALHSGLKLALENCNGDYCLVWYMNEKDNRLHPYYWICPKDFTSEEYVTGEGVVGKVFKNDSTIRLLDYKTEADEKISSIYEGIDISSYICVPINISGSVIGCVEFIKTNGRFSLEEADVIEMLNMLIAIEIDETDRFFADFTKRNVLLSVRDVKRSFKNGDQITQVLKGVNLDVYEGEFLVLLGESGCGKSTLLNIIGGMDKADSGIITYLDKDVSSLKGEQLTKYRRDNIGYIFQSYNLMPNLNAGQNLQLIGELVKDPMDVEEALNLVGLKAKKKSYPSQLSGGQQQRISIARALIKKPRLILADEPTAALDYATSIEVLSVLENVLKQGTTLLMVTHNEEITRMADRVVRMRDGRTYEVIVNRHPVHAEELVW